MNIKQYRKKINLTQDQLARIISVDTTTVTKWESGEVFPRADKLPSIAKALNCKIDDLFSNIEGETNG